MQLRSRALSRTTHRAIQRRHRRQDREHGARELHGRASAAAIGEQRHRAGPVEVAPEPGHLWSSARTASTAPGELHDRASAAERVEAPTLPPPSPASW
jgi:hypothetical protein